MKPKILLISLLSVLALTGCGTTPDSSSQGESSTSGESSGGGPSSEQKAEFEGITFASQDVYYDGEAHTIEVANLPDFATVTYDNAGPFTEIGSYDITATITATNYITLQLEATLNIKPLVFVGITMDDVEASYDNQRHYVCVNGTLPEEAQVTYTSDVEGVTNNSKEPGIYHVTAVVTAPHYETLTLTATLSILKTISNLYFNSKTVKYNGKPQSIVVTGSNASNYSIVYEPTNTFTEVGVYEVTAIINAPNTREWRKTATLTITEGEISASFNSQSFNYDGRNHSIKVSGSLPAGSVVTYECTSDPNVSSNKASEIGSYTIQATIEAPNYATKVLTATLTIKEGKVNRRIAVKDGVVYFTNPYDHNYLYILDENGENPLSIINHDDIDEIKIQDSTVLYTAKSDNNKTLKEVKLNYNTSKYVANNLRGQVDYFEKYTSYETGAQIYSLNGGYIYRSNNDSNGELTYTRLAYAYGGSKNIAMIPYNKAIYTMDTGTNYGYLLFASATGGSSTSSASYVTMDTGTALNNRYSYRLANADGWAHNDNSLYFNCNAYDPNSQSISGIYAYTVPYNVQASGGSFKRLSSDFGSEFTLASDTLYYLYKASNSDLYAKNIRYVNATGYGSSSVETIITASETSKGFGGLTYADGCLYYFDYEASGTQLIRYNVSTHEKVDILAPYRNYIIPYSSELIDQQTKIGVTNFSRNNTTYRNVVFPSLDDGGKLHLYDLEDEFERRLTTEQVSNFQYTDGVLVFNEIEYTNLNPNENLLYLDSSSTANSTYFISKNTGGTIILTNNSRVYTYAAGVGIRRHGFYTQPNDGTLIYNDSNKTLYNFQSSYNYYDKGLYFMQDGNLLYYANADTGTSSANVQTIIAGTTIVDYLVAGTTDTNQKIFVTSGESLKVHALDGSEISTIMEGDISNLQYYSGSDSIYFYNRTGDTATEGIYKINISGDTFTPELVVLSEEYVMDNFVVSKDLIAFRNYDPSAQTGDCYVYAYVISKDSLIKLGR